MYCLLLVYALEFHFDCFEVSFLIVRVVRSVLFSDLFRCSVRLIFKQAYQTTPTPDATHSLLISLNKTRISWFVLLYESYITRTFVSTKLLSCNETFQILIDNTYPVHHSGAIAMFLIGLCFFSVQVLSSNNHKLVYFSKHKKAF